MAPKNDPNALTFPAQEQALGGERKVIEPLWDRSTEPPSITDFEAFQTWSHQEIRQAIDSADPQHINDMANSWRRVTESGKAARETFDNKMTKAKQNWQGASGDAAAAKVREYTDQAHQLLVSMQLVANDLDQTEAVLRETQAKVPDAPAAGDPKASEAAREAEAEARRVMQTFYQPGVAEVDGRTPRLPTPQPVAAVAGSSAGGGTAGDGSSGADSGSAAGASPSGSTPSGSSSSASSATPTDDPATTAAAMTPALPGTAGGGGTASGSSGGVGAPSHGAGTSAGIAGSAIGALAAAPKLGASTGQPITGNPAASTAPVGSAARTGAPMSGMFPPMARGKGNEDDERRSSDYLVAASNASELVGDLPMATQPVLGE